MTAWWLTGERRFRRNDASNVLRHSIIRPNCNDHGVESIEKTPRDSAVPCIAVCRPRSPCLALLQVVALFIAALQLHCCAGHSDLLLSLISFCLSFICFSFLPSFLPSLLPSFVLFCLLFFLFHRLISDVDRSIVTKFWHSPFPETLAAPNHQYFGLLWDNLATWSRISPGRNGRRYR